MELSYIFVNKLFILLKLRLMNVEEFGYFCLSFPGASEGMPFEGFLKNAGPFWPFMPA
ncbi:hypothetical protein EDB96_2034 [Flavobacterium sp. S87F.05.LMB.W.Kidney.N]|nr:hypothetical protein EDB96_2034 [Flavobacterium sp. S87F.05.LMB.W.Kidney.N]